MSEQLTRERVVNLIALTCVSVNDQAIYPLALEALKEIVKDHIAKENMKYPDFKIEFKEVWEAMEKFQMKLQITKLNQERISKRESLMSDSFEKMNFRDWLATQIYLKKDTTIKESIKNANMFVDHLYPR